MVKLVGFEKEYSELVNRYKSKNLPNSILIHGYKKIANSKRYITVDASLSKDIIHKNIIKKLKL